MAPYSLCIIIQVTVSTHWFKNTCGAILCSFWKCGTATKCSVQPRTSLPKLKENYKKLTKTVKAARTTWRRERSLQGWLPDEQHLREEEEKTQEEERVTQLQMLRYEPLSSFSFVSIWMEIKCSFCLRLSLYLCLCNVLFFEGKVQITRWKDKLQEEPKAFSKEKRGCSTSFSTEGLRRGSTFSEPHID